MYDAICSVLYLVYGTKCGGVNTFMLKKYFLQQNRLKRAF